MSDQGLEPSVARVTSTVISSNLPVDQSSLYSVSYLFPKGVLVLFNFADVTFSRAAVAIRFASSFAC